MRKRISRRAHPPPFPIPMLARSPPDATAHCRGTNGGATHRLRVSTNCPAGPWIIPSRDRTASERAWATRPLCSSVHPWIVRHAGPAEFTAIPCAVTRGIPYHRRNVLSWVFSLTSHPSRDKAGPLDFSLPLPPRSLLSLLSCVHTRRSFPRLSSHFSSVFDDRSYRHCRRILRLWLPVACGNSQPRHPQQAE